MYFFKKKGKQYLDLTGDLILTCNDRLVKARSTSAAPTKILNASYITNADLNIRGKLKATSLALRFIWGKPTPLKQEDTDLKKPLHISDTETEGRENCPVIDMQCDHFMYQCDRNGEVAISHCKHPDNKSEFEGNCINELCPKLKRNK